MITKFNDVDCESIVEFYRTGENLIILTEDSQLGGSFIKVELTKDDLFSLIGQLLRIQSEIRKEVDND